MEAAYTFGKIGKIQIRETVVVLDFFSLSALLLEAFRYSSDIKLLFSVSQYVKGCKFHDVFHFLLIYNSHSVFKDSNSSYSLFLPIHVKDLL